MPSCRPRRRLPKPSFPNQKSAAPYQRRLQMHSTLDWIANAKVVWQNCWHPEAAVEPGLVGPGLVVAAAVVLAAVGV